MRRRIQGPIISGPGHNTCESILIRSPDSLKLTISGVFLTSLWGMSIILPHRFVWQQIKGSGFRIR